MTESETSSRILKFCLGLDQEQFSRVIWIPTGIETTFTSTFSQLTPPQSDPSQSISNKRKEMGDVIELSGVSGLFAAHIPQTVAVTVDDRALETLRAIVEPSGRLSHRKRRVVMVCQLKQLSSDKLGQIPHPHLDDFDYLRDPQQFVQDFKNNPEGLVGAKYLFKCSDGYTRIFVIKRVLYRAEGIIDQASVVVEVECVCTESDCQWHRDRQVMKISFSSRGRSSEDALIREARFKAESTGDLWALNHLPQIIDSITITYNESTVQGRLKTHPKEKYEERVMRVTILEKLHPLSELEDPRDFAQVFYDILQIHQWLYECVGILHRDLSIGNIMFRRKDGKIYGVLNDFDLSSRVQNMDKGPTSNHRTGTRPFMSIDLLDPDWEGGHLYRHDIESLFYIMLCLACRYRRPNVPTPEPRAYAVWFSGTDLQPYFAGFTRWLRRIREKLHSGYKRRPAYSSEESSQPGIESDDDESSDSDEDPNFDWNTLNQRVSYTTMRSIMSSFQGQSLETRWASWNPEH
ncbi:protein kinase [Lentinula aff. detonsa]|uniref:Protein kinase n=1 Tax=Lentinula aff. detonsa TaxID=2804958 RepID=A0AA38NSY5_9AGAR|nr:protein kinase [Lentinula aff. detonsa]